MSHANAALTPRARLRLAELVVESGWTYAAAAKMFMVHPRTAKKWADRYRHEGRNGMLDRSSRPHTSPTRTSPEVVRQIVGLRWRHRLGPVQIAGRLGLQTSTVHAVLVRCGINRLSHIDRVTGEPLRRYEHPHPGVADPRRRHEVRQHPRRRRVALRRQATRRPQQGSHRSTHRGAWQAYRPVIGTAFVHTVIDDYSRLAYAEICTDEKAHTAIGVLQRAVVWFADHGVNVERVLSDNGSAYKSYAWRDACTELGITPKRTRPYRPQTNGKIERFHRTLADGWAYARAYDSTAERNAALPGWLHFYNHHRAHSAIGAKPPISRITNVPGHHS